MKRRLLAIACVTMLLMACKKDDKDAPAASKDPCAGATFKNTTPPFCMMAPAGFKQGAPSGNFVRVDLPSYDGVALSWEPNATAAKVADLPKTLGANKLIEQGDTPGGKGKWLLYKEKDSDTHHIEVLVQGAAFTIRCADNGPLDKIKDGIAMCKSVAPM